MWLDFALIKSRKSRPASLHATVNVLSPFVLWCTDCGLDPEGAEMWDDALVEGKKLTRGPSSWGVTQSFGYGTRGLEGGTGVTRHYHRGSLVEFEAGLRVTPWSLGVPV